MKDFNLDMDDITGYIKDKTNLKLPDSFTKNSGSNSSKKDVEQESTIENLHSLNAQSEQLEKHISNRLVMLLILIPITLFLLMVFYKTYRMLQSNNVRDVPNVEKVEELGLQVNSDLKWKVLKDQETTAIADNVLLLRKELKSDINKTLQKVDEKLAIYNSLVQDELKNVQKSLKDSQEIITRKLSSIGRVQDGLDKKISTQKSELLTKMQDIKATVVYKEPELKLPKLPPLRRKIGGETHKSSLKSAEKSSNTNAFAKNSSATDKESESVEEVEYESVEEVIASNSVEYSSLDNYDDTEERNDSTPIPHFKLMPGFVKGTLLNGAEVPALLNGESESVPIYISINSNQLIANKATANINGCLVLATAKGELSKHAVNLRLSSISCNIVDLDGNNYEINQKIQGWVLSENGSYDIDGRIVSREKDIIKAGLPLAMVESFVSALSASMSGDNGTFLTTTDNNDILKVMGNGAAAGASQSTERILAKFSDYYLKMIESLSPTISIRAGREVTIAFKGGENLAMRRYDPTSVSYFQDIDLEEDEYEDEDEY